MVLTLRARGAGKETRLTRTDGFEMYRWRQVTLFEDGNGTAQAQIGLLRLRAAINPLEALHSLARPFNTDATLVAALSKAVGGSSCTIGRVACSSEGRVSGDSDFGHPFGADLVSGDVDESSSLGIVVALTVVASSEVVALTPGPLGSLETVGPALCQGSSRFALVSVSGLSPPSNSFMIDFHPSLNASAPFRNCSGLNTPD